MRIDDFTGMLENIAPLETQEEWDNSGWQIKLTDGEISKVMVALEINRQVIFDAVLNNIDLIITHHPLIFGGINNVDHNNNTGNYIVELIKHGISVYSTHTPFDKCHGGNNDYLGMILGLENVSLMGTDSSGFCRMGFVSGQGMKASYFMPSNPISLLMYLSIHSIQYSIHKKEVQQFLKTHSATNYKPFFYLLAYSL